MEQTFYLLFLSITSILHLYILFLVLVEQIHGEQIHRAIFQWGGPQGQHMILYIKMFVVACSFHMMHRPVREPLCEPLESHYASRTFYVSLYLELHRDPGWRFVDSKSSLNPRLFMLPTVLRRWSWCYSCFVWLCGFYYGAFHVESCLALWSRVVVVVVVFLCFFFFFSHV